MPDIEPNNREEIFLNNITRTLGGDDPVEIEPHNRQEHFLHNIAVALGADGVATDLEPNKRIEYLYKNIESIASANRNRVQSIESTMANPLGDIDPAELIPKLTNPFDDEIPSGATGFLSIDGTALGVGEAFGFIYASGSTGVQTNGAAMYSDSATCFGAAWGYDDITPSVNWIFMGQIPGDGTGAVMDVSAYAENLPTKLTIVWHDLNGGAGGGGNPNSVQTITGTLAEPFGNMTVLEIDDFRKALLDNTANAVMVVEASSVGSEDLTAPFSALGADGMVFQVAGIGASTGSAGFASYAITYDGGAPSSCVFNGVYQATFNYVSEESSNCEIIDLSEYGSLVPTTLTIIWHPLPE